MNHSTKTRSRVARAAFVALLMSSVATATLAAPAASRDAKLQAMQQQLDEMRAQMEQMRAQSGQSEQLTAMQQQLAAFGQQLSDMKAAQDAAASDIVTLKTPTGSTVIPSLPNGKPMLATADGRFSANIHAIVMFDAGAYLQKDNLPSTITGTAAHLNNGTNFRRARFGIDGKMFKDFDYGLIYEFGGSGTEDAGHIQEAWAQYTGFKPLRIKLGAFEPNIGLSAATSTSQMVFMERASAAEIARGVAAGDSRSALQIASNGIFGEGDSGLAARWFAAGAVTGNTVSTVNSAGAFATQPFGEQEAVIGRLAIAPFASTDWQAHLGVNAQYVFRPNDATGGTANPRYPAQLRDRPELRIDGTRLIDTGAIDARHVTVYGGEAAFGIRNFSVEGEYFKYKIDRRQATATATLGDPDFDGWYVQGAWVITGESRPYNAAEARFDAPKMAYNFNPAAGTWGAWELGARYSDTNLNWNDGAFGRATPAGGIRGGEQKIATVGLNWYLNPSMRFMLDYSHVEIDRLTGTGADQGQKFNTIALRSQLAF